MQSGVVGVLGAGVGVGVGVGGGHSALYLEATLAQQVPGNTTVQL